MKRVPADPEARGRERPTDGEPEAAPQSGLEPGRESTEEPAGAPAPLAPLNGAQPASAGGGAAAEAGWDESGLPVAPRADNAPDEGGDDARVGVDLATHEGDDDSRVPAGLRRLLGGDWRQSALYIDAAYTLLGAVLGLGFIGWLADRMLGTRPVFLLVGLLLGLVVGFYRLGRAMFGGR